ncbi:hypothetical protein N172_03680 [Pantoea dispersa EGD-AAK13]|nr:hypothetical protein N172_03680 [Pantoea dispersa EGD-AAK13]
MQEVLLHIALGHRQKRVKSLLTISEDFIRMSVLRDDSIIKIAGKIPNKKTKSNDANKEKSFLIFQLSLIEKVSDYNRFCLSSC